MILCDIDGVLAMGPVGDTAVGEPIYRTSLDLPAELERIAKADIPFYVVTAKVQAQALQVLAAVGVSDYVEAVISADRLFWPSIWGALRRGRLPGSLSKSVCRPMLPERRSTKVVMIENHHPHLYDMLAMGVIDFGILVPPITIADGRVRKWFDLGLAFSLAATLASGGVAAADLSSRDLSVFRWATKAPKKLDRDELPARIEEGGYLLRLPSLSVADPASREPALETLDTGRVLLPGRPNVVTTVRSGRRLIRRIVTRLFPRSA